MHHADLAAGYTFADVPPEAARWIIDDIVAAQRRRSGVLCEATPWEEIETQSGLSRADVLKAARVYGEADRSIVSWCGPRRTTGARACSPPRSRTR